VNTGGARGEQRRLTLRQSVPAVLLTVQRCMWLLLLLLLGCEGRSWLLLLLLLDQRRRPLVYAGGKKHPPPRPPPRISLSYPAADCHLPSIPSPGFMA
jgi:hypothetical protein